MSSETTPTAETKPKAPTTEDVLRVSEFSALNACLIASNDIASLASGQMKSNTMPRLLTAVEVLERASNAVLNLGIVRKMLMHPAVPEKL